MSNLWQILYRTGIPPEQTAHECDLIEHFIPRESHRTILDLTCETGRHSIELASRGYAVTGVDVDPRALQVAREHAAEHGVEVKFIEADLRNMRTIEGPFDGIILFWRSFGFFDDQSQIGIFSELERLLRPGGRFIIDLYNRLHFARGTEQRPMEEERSLALPIWSAGDHPESFLGYEDDLLFAESRAVHLFDPHLFTPGEIAGIAASYRFRMMASCSGFNAAIPATPEEARMQLVFEKG